MFNKPLTVDMIGENVAALHQALAEQGLSIPEAETRRRFFGPATRLAVGKFQKTHGINPSCEVCEKTAKLLASNLAVASSVQPNPIFTSTTENSKESPTRVVPFSPDVFPLPNSEEKFIVNGTIRQETGGFPLEGMRVVAVDKYIGGESILGEAITNFQGNYEIQYLLASIIEKGKQNSDLQIKVTKPNTPDQILAVSGVFYNRPLA
jgi:peptidoglycan hydrolase-like protein with peptidoglycan-binding domain